MAEDVASIFSLLRAGKVRREVLASARYPR